MSLQANHWRRNGRNTRLEQAAESSLPSSWIRVGTEKDCLEARVAVKLVQEALIAPYVDGVAGCSIPAGATGTFGNQTALAVQALQADPRNGLSRDSGIVGPNVLRVLDRKMLAIEAGAQTRPVQRFVLRPAQYAALIEEIHSRYRDSPYRIQEENVLLRLMQEDYPAVAFEVSHLLTYEEIRQSYIPPEWLMPQSTESWRESVRQEGEVAVRSLGWEASVMDPPPLRLSPLDPYPDVVNPEIRRFLMDLDTLRGGNPVAALTFIQLSARGVEAQEAMDWARAAGATADLLPIMTPGGWVAHSRAISPYTGRPRNARYTLRPTSAPSGWRNRGPSSPQSPAARRVAQAPNQMPASAGWQPPTQPERFLGADPAELRRLLTYRLNPARQRR